MLAKIRGWVSDNRAVIFYMSAAIVIISCLYLIQLGSFVRGDSVYETPQYLHTTSIGAIFENISLAPVKFSEFIMQQIDTPNSTLLRLISVFCVLITLVAFYKLIAKWHSTRVAVFSTFLFATSTYALHMARFTNQDVLYFMVIPLLLLFGTWMKSKKMVNRLKYVLPAAALMLYIPGVIYIFAVLAVVFNKRIALAFRVSKTRNTAISAVISFLLIVPLFVGLIAKPGQLSHFFAVDVLFGDNLLSEIGLRLKQLADSIFIHGPDEPYRWLTGTPILDIASVVLLVLGIYAYIRGPHTLRARTLGILFLLSVILFSLGSLVSVALVVPLLYIVIANGLAYLLLSWFTVFPRNPAARNTAIALLIVLVAVICGYHLERYFIAWHEAPGTRNALSVKSTEMIQ